jgi:hypothetical protein
MRWKVCRPPVVMLAERTFHESTIASLNFYGGKFPEWKETAAFLQIIRRWWNIVKVRLYTIGKRKREVYKEPISSAESVQINFLHVFSSWFRRWQELHSVDKRAKLSQETFMCGIQTSSTLPFLVAHLLQARKLSYVLIGKINCDAIERRFGHYRQLAGAYYYLSVRQFLEAEKMIRL